MKLYITTQDYENYGYKWKPKGSTDYIITLEGFDWENASNDGRLDGVVKELAHFIEVDDNQYKSHILTYSAVMDWFVTEFEQSQLDEEGYIPYPAVRRTYHEMLLWNM